LAEVQTRTGFSSGKSDVLFSCKTEEASEDEYSVGNDSIHGISWPGFLRAVRTLTKPKNVCTSTFQFHATALCLKSGLQHESELAGRHIYTCLPSKEIMLVMHN